ncbi:hypothetical protein EXIGLDRAFT_766708 [Exidia glandulosa HHB12029]|uniref:histidine kinase n=1 Tax=Exidia glandulosa HHB12029 TaxID=1314781 RepID=A0A165JGV1_EXIGL|nr:hypothetical protein EXIGLDRAFT_766708 [Exidia glandulosa HHB12029]
MVLNFEMAQKKAEELASLDRAKTVFFSNVSHELRTPLTLIMGPLDDILSEPSDSPLSNAKARLKVVARHARKLHGLVNSLLDFARLEAGRYLALFRPVDLGAITADIASLFRSAIERGRVTYSVDCVNGKEVYVDTDAWEKIVTNIISNAFKYCLEGTIEVRVEYTKTDAVFSCSDTGCGIPASDLSYIFNRFHRVETAGARSIEGTGVGLALTYETVKSLGGDIDVRSEVGVGSTFTVRLPLGTAHIPPERIVSGPPPETSAGERESLRYSMRIVEEARGWVASETSGESNRGSAGRDSSVSERDSTVADDRGLHLENSVVIIADDNPDLRHYCVSLLSPKYIVKAFPDGRAALDYILNNDADLVLSGADDYLVKPFASKELLARVKTHLELGRLRKELEARVQDRTRLLVESETRLLQQIAESEHMRKQQEIVVDLTSHELRNPLNAIWQNAELIQIALALLRSRTGPDLHGTLEEADDAVQNIVLSVAHQTRIADDILNFSKIRLSLLSIHREPFHLHDTVEDVLRMWEIETRERDIKLELKAPDALRNVWVNTDPHRCAQILINFLTNAIRFTADSPTRNITVFLESFTHVNPPGPNVFRVAPDDAVFPDGFWLRIGVQDSGSGLSPQEREKLFERFAQAHPSKDQFSGGHGLGLFVSRHIVLLLSGYIEVESKKGDGCTFSFSIPVELSGPQEGYDRTKIWRGQPLRRSTKPYEHRSATERTLSGNVRPRHVLIVEDNIINQKVLTRQLQAKGFHTSVANDGQEGLDRIFEEDSAPDVVLMDIEMPVKDGKTACRELRDRETRDARPRLPVIAVTGNARDEQIQECLQAGFDDCVIKPYRIADIVGTIDRFLVPRDFPTALAPLPSSAPTSPDVSTREPILG